jgi:hypothetical protein
MAACKKRKVVKRAESLARMAVLTASEIVICNDMIIGSP